MDSHCKEPNAITFENLSGLSLKMYRRLLEQFDFFKKPFGF